MEVAQLGAQAPAVIMEAIEAESNQDMIFVDSLTSAITQCSDHECWGCSRSASACAARAPRCWPSSTPRRDQGKLVIRLRSLCDAHLQLRGGDGAKLVRAPGGHQVRGAEEKSTGNLITFEVEPGWGMRLIPVSRMKG